MGTLRAANSPMAEPTTTPAMIVPKPRMSRWNSVATIASSMPTAATVLPDRAVAGELSRFSPAMNRAAATR